MQNRITADIAAFRLPRYAQIPEVGLYLEQVVRYINARLAPLGEPELTGSMVSNYVKQKLVPAPQKKLYTAEHLARLLFIAVVKPVVPLEGLRLMFSIQEECYPLQTAYDYFCDEFENMLGAALVSLLQWRDLVKPSLMPRISCAARSRLPSTRSVWTGIWRSIERGGSRLRLLWEKKSPCYSRNAVWQLQKEYPRLGRGYSLRLSAMITVQNRRTCSGPFIAMS